MRPIRPIFLILLSVVSVCSVRTSHAAAPLQIGDATVTGTLTAATGSTFNLSLATVSLPSDVTRLGSSISLTAEVSGILPVANGGTGTATPALLAGANIGLTGTFPAQTIALSGIIPVANGGSGTATPSLVAGTGVTISGSWPNQTINSTASGSGSVTSVGLALPAIFSVSGSPVTSTGTLTGTLATQTANSVFSGPVSGAAATPAFRSLVAADIPSLDASKITSGIFPVANGGSGTATPAIVAGTNVTVSGSWPNQTINASITGTAGDLVSTLVNSEVALTGATTLTSTAVGKMHVCSGTSANYTVDLPAASGNAGKIIGFRMASGLTKLVTLDANASELIDTALTRVLWAQESAILLCDGTGWTKLAGRSIPFYVEVAATAGASTATGFTKVVLATVTSDVAGLWSTTNNQITIPRPGSYSFDANFRLVDSFVATSYGVGVHTALGDGSWFTWQDTNQSSTDKRNGAYNRRTVRLTASGANYFLYYYLSGGTGTITGAQLTMTETCLW